ncbi:MAG TPA: glutathione S-transferase family protein [Phenylobacterium sp.]
MSGDYVLFSAQGSGGVAVEAALTLIGTPFELVETPTFDPASRADGDRVLAANPLRQVPVLLTPGGETLTESAAILIWLAEQHPQAGLAPRAGDAQRGAFLRWMAFVAAAIYAHYWLKDEPSRLVTDPALHPDVDRRIEARISACWAVMEAELSPGRYLLGDSLGVLDLYVTVVSRFRPRRQRFYAAAPRMGEVVRRVDDDPRLLAFWSQRYPFAEGWDRI